MNSFAILTQFLRDRHKFLESIHKAHRLEKTIISLLVASSSFFALYGAIIGSFSGPLQVVASAIKLPALYLITLAVCLPNLYFLDTIAGSRRRFEQYLALLLTTMALIGLLLFGFAPVTLFFRLSINDYKFFKLLNVAIFAFTGLLGVGFFYRGLQFLDRLDSSSSDSSNAELSKIRIGIIRAWLVLYALVGCQLGWILRPFFGAPGQPFQLFRELESNFYLHLFKVIAEAFGLG